MKTYSGSTSEGFLPATLPAAGAAATAVAPAPQDPSATFADALEQQTPKAPAFVAWPTPPTAGAAGNTPPLPVAAAANGDAAALNTDPTSLPMLPSTLLFTTASTFNPPLSNAAPATPAAGGFSIGDDAATRANDSNPDQAGTSAATLPSTLSPRAFTTYAASTWFGQRTASSSTPAGAASNASTTATSLAATADPSTEPDLDFTGAAIVASVFGRSFAPKPAATPMAEAPTNPPQSATTPAGDSPAFPAPLAGSPLATIMAHAAILAATSKNGSGTSAAAAATSSTEATISAPAILAGTPFAIPAKPSTTPSNVEKKSGGSSSERSFLQESPIGMTALDATTSLLQAAVEASSNLAGNQSVTTSQTSSINDSYRPALASISTAGMANGKKVEDMNSTLEMTSLVVSSGTHPLVTSTTADLHIALDSNANFTDALHQVMHIAELNNMSRSTPPLRVAIEIQTPPGAIVNVYVSRQSDSSYRAQLSTSDPQALAWVQNQISSLKGTTDAGSAIRWSPAQLEPGTASLSTSSSSANSERGYDWNRGGQQGQSDYQQDERNNRRRSTYMNDEPETAAFETFSAVGGVA